jgi:hypothetical protein
MNMFDPSKRHTAEQEKREDPEHGAKAVELPVGARSKSQKIHNSRALLLLDTRTYITELCSSQIK